jgi:hypothetical protein
MIEWHKILGMALVDFFSNTNYLVEIEKELKIPQFLDYLVVNKVRDTDENDSLILPDGMESLSQYNLLTFKSSKQPLDRWAIDELICYYVLFRKIISPSGQKLIPENEFKLFAIATRFPNKLSSELNLIQLKEGVYRLKHGVQPVNIIVISRLPKDQKNAIFHLLSTNSDKIEFGLTTYIWNHEDLKYFVLNEMFQRFEKEGIQMSYTVEDFKREVLKKSLPSLSVQERLEGLRAEDVLNVFRPEKLVKKMRPEDVLNVFRPEERLKGLRPEERLKGLRPEERLKGLRPEDIEILKSIFMKTVQK